MVLSRSPSSAQNINEFTPRLQPLLTILKAHDFPPTTLRFSPMSDMLVSGSADNTVRIVAVPPNLGATCELFPLRPWSHPLTQRLAWGSWILFLVALLVALFAVLAQEWYHVIW